MSHNELHHELNHYPDWEMVIGLEVHVQLATKSKLFSAAATTYGAEANTQACAIDLALPGVLPVFNKQTLQMAVKLGLGINAKINHESVFARKNYFYPDLPKGYQISQHDKPIIGMGHLDILLEDQSKKRIAITRAHLEEDAGKSIHLGSEGVTGIDLNRAGTPLLEIVSEPDIRQAYEAVAYLKTLHRLVRYLEISDGNMQEGSFRCDANVSVRKRGDDQLGTRTEIKNLNSFRYVEHAILYEAERQIECLEDGGQITLETRLYDPELNETRSMRSKEEAHDYRYFPDPDLLPVRITDEEIAGISQQMPELPWDKKARFIKHYQLSDDDANYLVASRQEADYFEACLKANPTLPAKLISNWLAGEMAASLNREQTNITTSPISPTELAELLSCIHEQTISKSTAKKVFAAMWAKKGSAKEIIAAQGLSQMNDQEALARIIKEVLDANTSQIADYHAGKNKLLGFFVGKIMQASRGRANPNQVNQLLKEELAKRKDG